MPFSLLQFRRTVKNINRLRQIVKVFLKYEFGFVIDQIRLHRFIPLRKRLKILGQWPSLKAQNVPEKLRMAFAELGPSFIKFAQLLSSRPDLITSRFADEFKKLQDRVPPFSSAEAKRIIEEEIHQPIHAIFSEFADEPIAAASIAQVHVARLLNGDDVVVKVQRPNIREQIDTDINILTIIANLMEKHFPESRFFNPTGIVSEFAKTTNLELDFVIEAKNCNRFKRNFHGNENVYFPKVYSEYVTEKILVMEKLNGVRIDDIPAIDAMGLDRKELARIGVDAYFKMTLEDGFFHADPHPGNIFAMPDGRIGFMDFGIVGRVSSELKKTMANTFTALISKDFDKLIDQYIDMGLVPENADLYVFKKDFKADIVEFIEPLFGMTLQEINFAEYLDYMTRLAVKYSMKIPSDFLLVNKAMLVLENIGSLLDPDFDFASVAEPYARKIISEKMSPESLRENLKQNIQEIGDFAMLFPRQMKYIVKKVLKDDVHLKLTHIGFDNFVRDMDKSSNRLSFSLIVSSIILSSAILHASGVGPKIFDISIPGFLGFGFASLLGIWLVISIIRSGRL